MLSNYQAWEYLWHPVCSVKELDHAENGIRECKLLGQKLVVARLKSGLAAFESRCRHRSAALVLGRVEGDCVRCPYHGWLYDKKGQCVEIPAAPDEPIPKGAKIQCYDVEERYGLIWVRLKPGVDADIPELPHWNDGSFHYYQYAPIDWKASATRTVEGFFDLAHFSFIHPTSLGNPEDPRVNVPENFRLEDREVRFRYTPKEGARNDGLGHKLRYNDYRLSLPFNIHMESKTEGENTCVWQVLCPVDRENVRIFFMMARPRAHTEYEGWVEAVQQVIDEDKAIIESQEPAEIPDLRQELSLSADKASMVYRRFISRLSKAFERGGPEALSALLNDSGPLQ